MQTQWIDRREGFRYAGFQFSEDGHLAREGGVEYREVPFAEAANRRFRIWLIGSLMMIVPGMPLLAWLGILYERLLVVALLGGALSYWLHARIHRCPQCGGRSRVLSTPHMDSPVLYLCSRCRTFFEHGQIDGGLPWK